MTQAEYLQAAWADPTKGALQARKRLTGGGDRIRIIGPASGKVVMPSSSDLTRVGRRLTLGAGAESSLEGRDIELSVSPKDIPTSTF